MGAYDVEQLEGQVRGALLAGPRSHRTGVIVLGGLSGSVDLVRAGLFAETGAKASALQWFGGAGQSPGICEIPLETFVAATDYLLSKDCERIVFVGTSKGAEAALLVATIDQCVDAVVAISPSSVLWGNVGPGIDGIAWPERSSWSFEGSPLDFVPADPHWERDYRDGLVSHRSLFEKRLTADHHATRRAQILIERASGDVILVAGGDDALWPSDTYARDLARRREAHGKSMSLVFELDAGHRVLLPGEATPRSKLQAHGGRDEADARLGQKAWQVIAPLL
ncbi:acyl-CoA thioester hydrolase/BAAT C-terminal domain-containing protein [Mesorhizobium carmichaelinearum]|uniref:acyl-CoA thioester hydrolase/BAAT C-terminal domain-containing protein n=1 Tax=Mesorhizobium carmichaelinearum TaxID=1208188 RepID=UPI000BA31C67|nr:acyl-CoA thioester hydrolase/BAAT C-terminal domain-containing protein [Mesorhizobium carmichaelinearum]